MKISLSNIIFILTVSILTLTVFSCKENIDTAGYSIEGTIENLSIQHIFAIKEITNDSIIIDTVAVDKKGNFSFKGTTEIATTMSLFIGEETVPVNIFIDNGYQIKVKGDATNSDLIEVKGGEVNDDIYDFKTKNANLLQTRHRILSKNDNLDPAELKNVNLQIAKQVREYVERHPTRIASVVLMSEFSVDNTSPESLGKDIELLKGEASHFYMTTKLKAYYDKIKVSAVGSVAPEIDLKNTKGKTVKLQDFKGKPILLIFDLKESPTNTTYFDHLKEVQKELKNKISFISIVINENGSNPSSSTIETAKNLDWTVLLDEQKWNSKAVKKYNVTSAPYMILISEEGLIEERDVDLDSLAIQFNKKDTVKKRESEENK